MNEQQWQECPLEEATHAKTATGQIYELDGEKDIYIESTSVSYAVVIDNDYFTSFGITPVKVKTVEFVDKADRIAFLEKALSQAIWKVGLYVYDGKVRNGDHSDIARIEDVPELAEEIRRVVQP